MSLKTNILEKVIKPQSDAKFEDVVAKVTQYDKDTNTANVIFKNPKNLGVMELKDVSVFFTKGFKSQSLKSGDNVIVTFLNGSILQPCITGVIERTYMFDTRVKQRHRRKGSFIIEREYKDVEVKKYKDLSNVDSWISTENNNSNKFHIHAKSEPIFEMVEAISKVGYFDDDDIGLYHPDISSIVKLRLNGTIDIFTSCNQGIRINPNEKSISFFADKVNFQNDRWYIESDDFEFKGKNFTIDANTINLKSDVLNIDYNTKKEE